MLKLAIILSIYRPISAQVLTYSTDIQALSELSLEKLLEVKKSFKSDEQETIQKSDDIPQALPLQSKQKPKKRGYHHVYHTGSDEYHQKKDKKSVQHIFQLSVTTLAFLAFGGYLLCLLVQAIKGKDNNMYGISTTEVMSALINSRPQVIRRTRRRKVQRPNLNLNQGYKKRRPKRSLAFTNAGNMYYALIDLSEGYAKFNTVNYVFSNGTSSDSYDFRWGF